MATGLINAAGYDAKTGVSKGYKATNWNVNDDQLVDRQVARIVADDSVLMQQAATQGKQAAATKGLVNSSMGVGAAQGALYAAAAPMASQNASTYAGAAEFNAGATNEAERFTAQSANEMTRENMNAVNTQRKSLADAQNQIRLQLSSALLGVLTQRLLPRADGLGRTLVCEVLLANEAVRNLIREGRAHR